LTIWFMGRKGRITIPFQVCCSYISLPVC
jgi:hypothetical protein